MLSNLDPTVETGYSLWQVTKNTKCPKNHIPPIINNKGEWARPDTEKATAFAEYLNTVFQPLPKTCYEHTLEIKEYLGTANQLCLPRKGTSPKEVYREIKNLQEGKAPGHDLIVATLLKKLPFKGIMKLVQIFYACFKLEIFPGQWKIAQVVMIPKPGKPPQETTSYRPISLLSVVGKLFERILLHRMKEYLGKLLPKHQFGFRERHGTIEQVHRIVISSADVWKTNFIAQRSFLTSARHSIKYGMTDLIIK